MDETVLVYPDIDKRSKSGDIGHHPLKHHPLIQVSDLTHVVPECRCNKLGPRITPRLFQLFHNVPEGRKANRFIDIAMGIDAGHQQRVGGQFRQGYTQVRSHPRHHRVSLRMNRRPIQWIASPPDAEKAG